MSFHRIHVVVLDSLGIGGAPDAAQFGDADCNTLLHIDASVDSFHVPHLAAMGMGQLVPLRHVPAVEPVRGYYGAMREASVGKDTMTGHWEMMGLRIETPFQVFPDGFPDELIARIEEFSGRRVIVNAPASGTEVIAEYGAHQMRTGDLIVYTSADSVLQIAAHEEIIPLEELYRICDFCRSITLEAPYAIGRIIARPYVGTSPADFKRTSNRHDYALKPFGRTVLNSLADAGLASISIGKIRDIFDGEGITEAIKAKDNVDGVEKLIDLLGTSFKGLSFTNLVDFDAQYGHRRDPQGYARCLEEFDALLPRLFEAMHEDDLLILTADHGNDPTAPGTDHTREQVPLLVYSPRMQGHGRLPTRSTFADLGATIAENFGLETPAHGVSFLSALV